MSDRNTLLKTYKGRYVLPGFLSRQIKVRAYLSKDKQWVKVRIGPTEEAYYGTQFVEVGTATIAKQPWLQPAFDASQGVARDRLAQRLKALIEKAAKQK